MSRSAKERAKVLAYEILHPDGWHESLTTSGAESICARHITEAEEAFAKSVILDLARIFEVEKYIPENHDWETMEAAFVKAVTNKEVEAEQAAAHAAAEAMRSEIVEALSKLQREVGIFNGPVWEAFHAAILITQQSFPDSSAWLSRKLAEARLEEAKWWNDLPEKNVVEQDRLANDRLVELERAANGDGVKP